MESQTQHPATKTCTSCKVSQPVTDFHKHPATLDRRQSWCKNCGRRNSREYWRRTQREAKEQQLAS